MTTDSAQESPRSWWTPFLLVAAGMAALPCYGYFVRANREGQLFFLVLAGCWGLSFISWVVTVVSALLIRKVRKTAVLAAVLLAAAILAGFGGLRVAFNELLAG